MASSIRMRSRLRNGITIMEAIIRHPMETGFRVDEESGETVPAHYIKLVTVKHNGETVLSCDWSRAVSRNPYLSFEFDGAKSGDKLELSWFDTKGQTDSTEITIE